MKGNFVSFDSRWASPAGPLPPSNCTRFKVSERDQSLPATISNLHHELVRLQSYSTNRFDIGHNEHTAPSSGRSTSDASSALWISWDGCRDVSSC